MRPEKVVTKAVESAPSAKRSRNMFGARNAVRNASMFLLAPKSDAKTTSRSKPSTRLHRMAMPTTPVARALTRLFGLAMAVTDATQQRSGTLRKGNQCCRLGYKVKRVTKVRTPRYSAGAQIGQRHSAGDTTE